jgi:hypothetical protein
VYGWEPGIGDPTLYGWVTVAAYAVAALACWRAFRSAPRAERRAWLVLTVGMAFLAVNKQADLQSLLTALGRGVARAHGWYEHRRSFQALFIAAMAGAGLIVLILLLRSYRRASLALQGALAGAVLLCMFILIRASSFEKMDHFINTHLAGVRANHAMELGGIAIIAACAFGAIQPKARKRLR